jgi:O-antigen/teichoic acid export membrane protein
MPFPASRQTDQPDSVSLRSNFAWTFAGNVLYSASQWAVLSLIAKLGDREMLGRYALAVAVATPVVMLSHLNLRAVLATDTEYRHSFGDYLAVRLRATALGLAAIAVIAFVSGGSWTVTATILLVGMSLSAETVSDIYYGAMQRRERMDLVARSMMIRGGASVAVLGAVLWVTRDLVAAVAALAIGRIAVLVVYDLPRGTAGEILETTASRARREILSAALPLGVVLMLASLNANLPRYAIEYHLGTAELGAFAAVASFITVGRTVMNALGQAATPRLARSFSQRNRRRFGRLAAGLTGVALGLGAAGVLCAVLLGTFVLAVVFRPEYAAHNSLLISVMFAAIPMYVAIAIGYLLTSTRAFSAQMPLLAVATGTCAIASWLLVPRMGLTGAAAALAIAALAQVAGGILILRHRMRQLESAA